jgi:DNA-binding winged helix-turn-helix (wHTH) protein/TolB-like protein
MKNGHKTKKIYEFDEFRLDASDGKLWRGGEQISLTHKAIDLLTLLVERRGETLTKNEIIENLWRDTYVDENNLAVTVSTLRKAFGEKASENRFIETVPRRGYRFVADVQEPESSFVIEKQTQTHITIEEIERDETDLAIDGRGSGQESGNRSVLFVAAAGLIIGLSLLAAYFFWKRDVVEKKQVQTALPGAVNFSSAAPTIAVLPFKNLNQDAADDFIAFGLTDALISKLAGIRGLAVRPTNMVLPLAGTGETPQAIGEKLKVETILQGTFQKDGERLRVSVQLVRAADNQILWSGNFNENARDLFKFQDAFAADIAQKLRLNVSSEDRARMSRGETANDEAYRTYLQGRYFFNKSTAPDIKRAIELFEQVERLDSRFALAYAARAEAYLQLAEASYADSPPIEYYKKAASAIDKALVLNPNLPEAQMSLGIIEGRYRWNTAEAENAYRRVLALNPNLPSAHHTLGWNLLRQSRFTEAESELRRAAELDPTSMAFVADIGYAAFFAEDYETALREFSQALEQNKSFAPARFQVWRALHHLGRYEEALGHISVIASFGGKNFPVTLHCQARNLAKMGRAGEAREIYNQLIERKQKGEYISPTLLALISADLGDANETFRWMEESMNAREEYVTFYSIAPEFKPYRDDARFKELISRIKPSS